MTTYDLPPDDVLMAEYKQFTKDNQYFKDHWEELKRKYPDCYVAVFKGRVRAASPDRAVFLDELRRKGIPPQNTARRYVSEKRRKRVPYDVVRGIR